MIRTVIFDLGDTLIDLGGKTERQIFSEACHEVHRIFQEHGIPFPTLKRFRRALWLQYVWQLALGAWRHKEVRAVDLTARTLARLGVVVPEDLFHQIALELFDAYSLRYHLFDGIGDFLGRLRGRGVTLGLLSNTVWTSDYMLRVLKRLGLDNCFDAVVFSADFGIKKPSPAIFQELLKRLNARPAETLMVGDSYRKDIVPAKRLGLTTVWCNSASADKPHPRADYVVTEAAGMFARIEELTLYNDE